MAEDPGALGAADAAATFGASAHAGKRARHAWAMAWRIMRAEATGVRLWK
jgi:hypothetical protein